MAEYWKNRKDLIGLSSESKPTGEVDGTTFYEVDTSDFYIYYKGTWYLQGSAGVDDNE